MSLMPGLDAAMGQFKLGVDNPVELPAGEQLDQQAQLQSTLRIDLRGVAPEAEHSVEIAAELPQQGVAAGTDIDPATPVTYCNHETTYDQLVDHVAANFYEVVHQHIREHPELAGTERQIAEEVVKQALNKQGYEGSDGNLTYKELLSASVDIWNKMQANPDTVPQADSFDSIVSAAAPGTGTPTAGTVQFRTTEFDFSTQSQDFGTFATQEVDFTPGAENGAQVIYDDMQEYIRHDFPELAQKLEEAGKMDDFTKHVLDQAFGRQSYDRDNVITDIELESIIDSYMDRDNQDEALAAVMNALNEDPEQTQRHTIRMTAGVMPGTDPVSTDQTTENETEQAQHTATLRATFRRSQQEDIQETEVSDLAV